MFILLENAELSSRNFALLNRAFNKFKSTTNFRWRASVRLELEFMPCLWNDKRVEVLLWRFQSFAYWSVGTQEKSPSFCRFFSSYTQGSILRLFGIEKLKKIICLSRWGLLHNTVRGKKAYLQAKSSLVTRNRQLTEENWHH